MVQHEGQSGYANWGADTEAAVSPLFPQKKKKKRKMKVQVAAWVTDYQLISASQIPRKQLLTGSRSVSLDAENER